MWSLSHIHEGITQNISDEKPIGWWHNLIFDHLHGSAELSVIHSFLIYGNDIHTACITCSTDIYIWQSSLQLMFDTVVNETYVHNQDKINPELSDLCASDLSMLMAGLRNPLADMRNPWALSSKYWWGDNSSHIPNFCIFSALTFIFMFATCSWLVL